MATLNRYRVRLKIRERIYGGVPKNPALMKDWLLGRGVSPANVESVASEVEAETAADIEAEKAWTTFKGNTDGIPYYYIEGRQLKAMLKDTVRNMKLENAPKAMQSAIRHGLEIVPYRIPVGTKIDGVAEHVVHAMTAQGPRTSIKWMDYIEGPTLDFEVHVGSPKIDARVLRALFEHASVFEGLGASVSQGYGKFDIESFEELKAN